MMDDLGDGAARVTALQHEAYKLVSADAERARKQAEVLFQQQELEKRQREIDDKKEEAIRERVLREELQRRDHWMTKPILSWVDFDERELPKHAEAYTIVE
jgi:hypothetical protein